MSVFKRMLGDTLERWSVLPALVQVSDRHHIPNGTYRLMECVGNGHYVERQTGGRREMEQLVTDFNKEGYITPTTKTEAIEKERFTVMERVRFSNLMR